MFPLPANQPATFYRGAGRIAAFRPSHARPTGPRTGSAPRPPFAGPRWASTLPDGRLLAGDRRRPGAAGSARTAPTPGCWSSCSTPANGCRCTYTPTALRHTPPGLPYGKTEAWVISPREPGAVVHLASPGTFRRRARGLGRRPAGRARCWPHQPDPDRGRATRSSARPAAARHRRRRLPGRDPGADRLLGAAGIRRLRPRRPADGHLGLGFDLALECVDRGAWAPDRVEALRGTSRLLPAAADRSSPPTGWAPGRCWGPRSRWWSSSPGPAR